MKMDEAVKRIASELLGSGFKIDDIRMTEEQKAVAKDPLWLVENEKMWITTKSGNMVRLRLNQAQKKVMKVIRYLQAQNKPVRIWILKARQKGISTLIEAIVYAYTSQKQNIHSLIVADEKKRVNYLFDMSKLYHEKMDKKFQYELKYSNEKKLEFDNRRSHITVSSSDDKEAGRTTTLQYVHLSEVAYFRDASKLMISLNHAVPKAANTMVIGETTANGVGGYFYNEWKKALKGEIDWYPLFIAWFEDPEAVKPIEGEFILTEQEQRLKEKYKLSNEQLNWRRDDIKNSCNGSEELFNQENPSCEEEAFLVSGNCRFNTMCLKKMLEMSVKDGEAGRLLEVNKNITFHADSNGKLRIYKKPKRGRVYIIGADVMEGKEIEDVSDEEDKRDYSTAEVLDAITLEQVAELQYKYEPNVHAEELMRLGKYYNNALIGVERNNHGMAVLPLMKDKYPNLYKMEYFDEDTQVRRKKLGWITSNKTKPLMIDEVDRVIREAESVIHSSHLISELMTYVRFSDGSTGAQSSCHDDLVMAYAIALQLRKYVSFTLSDNKRKEERESAEVEKELEKIRGY